MGGLLLDTASQVCPLLGLPLRTRLTRTLGTCAGCVRHINTLRLFGVTVCRVRPPVRPRQRSFLRSWSRLPGRRGRFPANGSRGEDCRMQNMEASLLFPESVPPPVRPHGPPGPLGLGGPGPVLSAPSQWLGRAGPRRPEGQRQPRQGDAAGRTRLCGSGKQRPRLGRSPVEIEASQRFAAVLPAVLSECVSQRHWARS